MTGLATPRRRDVIVLEAIGTRDGVTHKLRINEAVRGALTRQLQTAIPGLQVESPDDYTPPTVTRAWRTWQSTPSRSLSTDDPDIISNGLLTALDAVDHGELLLMRWLLGPVRRPQAVGTQVAGSHGGGIAAAVAKAPFLVPSDLDSEARRALRIKNSLPAWRAVLHLGVQAQGTHRQRQLLGQLASAVRVAQGPGVQVGFDGIRPEIVSQLRRVWRWRLVINVGELVGLSAWPLGATDHLPVARVRSRVLPPPRALARSGHVIGESSFPGQERPVAISIRDSLMHTHLVGSTGAGKSTLISNLIAQDMDAGRAVAVIEPKSDLIQDVLARVPTDRLEDVVLIDPVDACPVGLNPLIQPGVPGELVVDQVLAVFKGLFGDAIGPRTQDLLTAGLLTLVSQPGMSLVALPLLFTDAAFRQRLVAGIDDRIVLAPFWAWYENLSAGERSAVLAPLMNKLRSFLLRPRLRRVIGQVEPKFDLRELFTKKRILLVNLQKGALGPEATQLLGSLAVSMLWQTTLSRSSIPAERRHPTFLYVDEFQDFLHLPQDFSDVLAQSRGLGVGLTLAHQHLGQLTGPVKAAVIANARSRIIFNVSQDDAAQLVRSDARLTPPDLAGLRAYEAYATLLAGSEAQPFVSIRTAAPTPVRRDPKEAKAVSRRRWGVPATLVDASLEALVGGHPSRDHRESDTEGDGFGIVKRANRPSGAEGETV
jgi:hypothetical protein